MAAIITATVKKVMASNNSSNKTLGLNPYNQQFSASLLI